MMPPSAAIAGLLFAVALASAAAIRMRVHRPYLTINPCYREILEETGLTTSQALLDVPAVIVSGHPDRNVARVTLGEGANVLKAYLKREHRVRAKERLFNALGGFGLVSKSHREAVALNRIKRAGIPCADWIAYGQTIDGQAFLIVEALDCVVDLRDFFTKELSCPLRRHRFACRLGRKLARIHNAGFDQPDLYAKHVLVDKRNGGVCFLDWQRSRQSRFIGWSKRYRDLAALHATLPAEATTGSERIACLHSYLQACRTWNHHDATNRAVAAIPGLEQAAQEISFRAERLLNRRHIRQSRHISAANISQNVIWLNGETLCVTPALLEQIQGDVPDYLATPQSLAPTLNRLERSDLTLAKNRRARLVRRTAFLPLSLTLRWLVGKKWSAPEVRQAGLIFRLQRHGIDTPRLLAFGQRHRFPWKVESFLLTDCVKNAASLSQSLAIQRLGEFESYLTINRRKVIRGAAKGLARIHAAGCRFAGQIEDGLDLVLDPQLEASVALGRVDNLIVQRGNGLRHLLRDLTRLRDCLAPLMTGRTDAVRLVQAYLGLPQLDRRGKRLCRQLLAAPLIQLVESLDGREPDCNLANSASCPTPIGWRAPS